MSTAKSKKEKEPNPLVEGAQVIGGSILHRRLGRIVRVTKTLVEVAWSDSSGLRNDWFGRDGRSFHGKVTKDGEAIKFSRGGDLIENLWDESNGISIATESAKRTILEEQAKKQKAKDEQAAQIAAVHSDPAYQQRQADLKRYGEMLRGLGANIENGWNNQKDFRVELDSIKPEKMDALIAAIEKVLR